MVRKVIKPTRSSGSATVRFVEKHEARRCCESYRAGTGIRPRSSTYPALSLGKPCSRNHEQALPFAAGAVSLSPRPCRVRTQLGAGAAKSSVPIPNCKRARVLDLESTVSLLAHASYPPHGRLSGRVGIRSCAWAPASTGTMSFCVVSSVHSLGIWTTASTQMESHVSNPPCHSPGLSSLCPRTGRGTLPWLDPATSLAGRSLLLPPPLPSPPCLESRGRRQSRSISLASFEMSRVSRGSPPQKCNNRAWCCCEDSQSLSSLLPFHLGSQHWYLGNYRGCPSTAPFARGSPHRALFSPICLSRRDADASGCQQC